jgi:hypothetical protein
MGCIMGCIEIPQFPIAMTADAGAKPGGRRARRPMPFAT